MYVVQHAIFFRNHESVSNSHSNSSSGFLNRQISNISTLYAVESHRPISGEVAVAQLSFQGLLYSDILNLTQLYWCLYTALNVELALYAVSLRPEISLVTSAPTSTLTSSSSCALESPWLAPDLEWSQYALSKLLQSAVSGWTRGQN